MLSNEHIRDAVVADRRRVIAEGLRHSEFDPHRRGVVDRWRARRARRATATPSMPPPTMAPPRLEPLGPPFGDIRRTMPDMYR